MRRKRWLLLGLLVLGIAGAVIVTLMLLPPKPGVTKENFDRIEIGMARAEVEAIFGCPPLSWVEVPGTNRHRMDSWESDYGDVAFVHYGDDDRVASKDWDGFPDDRSAWQKILDQMPWGEREKHKRTRLRL